MGIVFYGDYLKKIREQAGLSQEKLADGIINLQSLNRIENNRAGVSPGTFQALTSKCGAPTEAFPLFANWDDFECFYELYKADMWLDSWQIKEAYDCLSKVENREFAGNMIYYQKWLYYQAIIHMRNGDNNYEDIMNILEFALRITKKKMAFDDIKQEFLTVTEIQILSAIAEISFMMEKNNDCLIICSQLMTYLDNIALSYMEKTSLFLGVQKIYILYLLKNKEYNEAMNEATSFRDNSLIQIVEKYIIESAFLLGLTQYVNGEKEEGIHLIKTAYYSGEAIESRFALVANNILKALDITVTEFKISVDDSNKNDSYIMPDINRNITLSNIECDYYADDVVTLGKLILHKRKEQKIPMKILCQGLCSVSALSKIENDTLQPGIFLSRSLLQRLGLSDEPFTFFGSERESRQYSLERRFSGVSRYDISNIGILLEEMRQEITENDVIFEQFYNDSYIFYGDTKNPKYNYILENMQKTLPDFQIDKIANYRLSKNEISYAIAYCMMVRKEESVTRAVKGLYNILEYINQGYIDNLLKNSVVGIVLATLLSALRAQKRNDEILELLPIIRKKIVYGHTECLPTIYAILTDVIFEEKNEIDKCYKYAYYLFVLHKRKAGRSFLESLKNRVGYDLDI